MSKKFAYQLEPVLEHRKLLEEAEQLGLAKITRSLSREAELLEEQMRQSQELSRELAAMEKGHFDLRESMLYRQYLAILDLEMQQTQERMRKLEVELVKKREELLKATRNRKVLDTHREREHTRFVFEQNRIEQKAVDEISVVRKRTDRESAE